MAKVPSCSWKIGGYCPFGHLFSTTYSKRIFKKIYTFCSFEHFSNQLYSFNSDYSWNQPLIKLECRYQNYNSSMIFHSKNVLIKFFAILFNFQERQFFQFHDFLLHILFPIPSNYCPRNWIFSWILVSWLYFMWIFEHFHNIILIPNFHAVACIKPWQSWEMKEQEINSVDYWLLYWLSDFVWPPALIYILLPG